MTDDSACQGACSQHTRAPFALQGKVSYQADPSRSGCSKLAELIQCAKVTVEAKSDWILIPRSGDLCQITCIQNQKKTALLSTFIRKRNQSQYVTRLTVPLYSATQCQAAQVEPGCQVHVVINVHTIFPLVHWQVPRSLSNAQTHSQKTHNRSSVLSTAGLSHHMANHASQIIQKQGAMDVEICEVSTLARQTYLTCKNN